MALNIKNPEVERLAAEAAKLANESKTEAIRIPLQDRVARLKMYHSEATSEQRIPALLTRFRKQFPRGDFRRTMTKAEQEDVLGFGSDGV